MIVTKPFVHPVRIIAQAIRSGEFLTWDLPLQDVEITYRLSGPQVIKGVFLNEVTELYDMGIEPWATWIHVEDQGIIRASGILQPYDSYTFDEDLKIEAFGVSSYPTGMPYFGPAMSRVDEDPVNIIRDIWQHLQSREDAQLGVVVRGSSRVRIGKPLPPEPPEGQPADPATKDDKPYELDPFEGTDSGDEIDKLVKEGGFDFIEAQSWNSTKTGVDHFIDCADRIGTRRTNVTFDDTMNVVNVGGVQELPDFYASEVWVFGAGEGSSVVRGYYGTPNDRGRIRRVATIQDNTINNMARANEIARYEYLRRQGHTDITEVEVNARHDNAQIGSYGPGDDVFTDVEVPWRGRISNWYRVLTVRFAVDTDTAAVEIRRADTFKR